jgi:molybdopterin molybdotransferase
VLILNAQESYKMDSVAQANCLVEFPEGATEINIGEKVKIWKV